MIGPTTPMPPDPLPSDPEWSAALSRHFPDAAATLPSPLLEAASRCAAAFRETRGLADLWCRSVAAQLAGASDAGAALASLHLDDLGLALACGLGSKRALEAFERDVLAEVESSARRLSADPDQAAEVLQHARERLLLAGEGRKPGILEYSGTGPLVAFARVTVTRLALNQRKAMARGESSDESLAAIPVSTPDPELSAMRAEHAAEFQAALRESFEALSPHERNLLRLYYLEGIPLAGIGRLHQVHESTAARWVTRCRESLLEACRERLAKRLPLSGAELDSLMASAGPRLELSISRILRGPGR